MKHINKSSEPESFGSWKADNPDKTYALFPRKEKKTLKKKLIQEQGGICCYCEQSIILSNSHIEHFRPQDTYKGLSLDYNNLLCSCQKEPDKETPLHCGHRKGNWFEEDLLVSPLDPSCEDRFHFTDDGRIFPAVPDDEVAAETIKRLALDIPALSSARKAVIEAIYGLDANTPLTREELQQVIQEYLKKKPDKKFNPFWTTVKQLYPDDH